MWHGLFSSQFANSMEVLTKRGFPITDATLTVIPNEVKVIF
jgi:hypothetical protein